MIIFDFDGVISDSAKWFDDVATYLAGAHGADARLVLEWMITQASASWIGGSWSDATFIEELNTSLSITATIEELNAACRGTMRIDPRIRSLIETLGPIAIFTDNPNVRACMIAEAFPSARVTASYAVGARKYEPGGFAGFSKRSGITSGLFIDDFPRNIEAARAAGFDALRWQLNKDTYSVLEEHIRTYRANDA